MRFLIFDHRKALFKFYGADLLLINYFVLLLWLT